MTETDCAELDRDAMTNADMAFMHSAQSTTAERMRDAVVAYLHAVEYAEHTAYDGMRIYPSLTETLAAVAEWRERQAPE